MNQKIVGLTELVPEKVNMVISSGLVIINHDRLLLVNPKSKYHFGEYSIPKGLVERGEDNISAAIREVYEETGILVPENLINKQMEYYIDYYIPQTRSVVKRVFYYFSFLEALDLPIILPQDKLQAEEIKYASFFTKEEAKYLINWRFSPILYQF